MHPIFKKLNYKKRAVILALNAPDSFQSVLKEMFNIEGVKVVDQVKPLVIIDFVIGFGMTMRAIDQFANVIEGNLSEDAIIWFAYPKKSSKNYKSEINRDCGWSALAALDLEPVRMVAIDEDWSALRFRNVDKIKKITRSKKLALTEKAKERTTNKK